MGIASSGKDSRRHFHCEMNVRDSDRILERRFFLSSPVTWETHQVFGKATNHVGNIWKYIVYSLCSHSSHSTKAGFTYTPRFKTSIPGISHESRINCVSPTLPLYSTIGWNGFWRLQPVLLGFSAFCFGVVCVQSSPQKNTADIERLHFWPEHQKSSRLVLACYTGSNLQIDRTVRNLEIILENAGIIIFVTSWEHDIPSQILRSAWSPPDLPWASPTLPPLASQAWPPPMISCWEMAGMATCCRHKCCPNSWPRSRPRSFEMWEKWALL